MPYSIEAAPGGGYRVKNTQTNKYHSKKGIPKARAERQMKLLYGIEQGMVPRGKKKDGK